MLNSIVALLGNGAGGGGGSYESIATVTGTGSSATITFSSIPSTYTSLQVRILGRTTSAQTNVAMYITYNSSTSGYANHQLGGDGATASTNVDISGSSMIIYNAVTGASATSGMMGVGIIDIHDYASTTRNKTFRAMSGNDRNGSGEIWLTSGFLNNTAALSSITLSLGGYNWATTSVVSLYGIKGA